MKNTIAILLLGLLGLTACEGFLDRKPDKTLVVPSSLQDARALLNNTYVFNTSYPGAPEVAAGDFYLNTADWLAIGQPSVKNSYIWQGEIFNESERNEWSVPYITVYTCNVILKALQQGQITGQEQEADQVRATALFFRSYTFYHLLVEFAGAWDGATAETEPGVALRLDPDLNIPSTRASLRQCYEQILDDMRQALPLLPETAALKTMPTRKAGLALLARIHLSMGQYEQALGHARDALEYPHQLLDFNTLDASEPFPFARYNQEVLLHTLIATPGILYPPTMKVDSGLMDLYSEGDLRKQLYFQQNPDGTHSFRGSFDGTPVLFGGLSVSELYLIEAECLARMDQTLEALQVLNALLASRWKKGDFATISAGSDKVLALILTERRKELAFRGIRWADLKRLNKEPGFAVTLKRAVDGREYVLPPGDDRYVFPIPESVIRQTGMEQNPR
ncbi:RagB/SusD family nutrient uptake outer membrane protein [Marinilongibacter aquaticus]|uniref:RagB/SusD family nutrient uptake outer membrane protein n=1 Tax=Marinilongibacter aquaticus TaxID=2975157 RepID=UPI0021BD9A34|nr:RagB/SusD family nutrient uptake outer membrane protein [Marinilongibacter aquaticus]UBM60795.1 RagB/SusD family nutrient uptake outer membrane protein [Marinilongibacter aquaticus]